MASRWTDTDKDRAVTVYVNSGNLAEAQRAIAHDGREPSKNSIRTWARAAGHDTDQIGAQAAEKTQHARDRARQTFAEARETIVYDLVELVQDGVRSAADYLADGHPDKARLCMTPVGVGVDKLLLLNGEANSIVRTPWDPKQVTTEAKPRAEGLRSVPTGRAV